MKKLLLIAIGATMLFVSCDKTGKKEQTANIDSSRLASDSVAADTSDAYEIDVKLARKMVDNYSHVLQSQRGSSDAIVQTQTVWLCLKRLKALVKQLEEEEKAGWGTDGLRIYFAKYPADYTANPAHKDRNTLVFVSTKQENRVTDNKPAVIHLDYFKSLVKKITSQ
jgi:hypothetical protein